MNIDLWYMDSRRTVDAIDVFFYPNDGIYRGNLYCKGMAIGDYSTKDSLLIAKAFPHIKMVWDL